MSVNQRREREREARRNAILDAAHAAFFADGFEAATMDDVALRAQLGKGTLYNYFGTKNELLLGVVVRDQLRMIERFEHAARQATNGLQLVRQLMHEFIRYMGHPPERLKMAMTRWASGRAFPSDCRSTEQLGKNMQSIMGTFTSAIVRGQQDGSIRVDCDPSATTINVWAAILGIMVQRLQLNCVPEPNPFTTMVPSHAQAIDFFVQALQNQRCE